MPGPRPRALAPALLAAALAAASSAEAAPEPVAFEHLLVPEPRDREPLGERVPLVLAHGFGARYLHTPMDPERDLTWSGFRSQEGYPGVLEGFKVYFYYYRPVHPYPELGRRFAEVLRVELPQGERGKGTPLVLLAHSAGALLARYAAAHPAVAPRVRRIVTLAGIHHGSVAATLAFADPGIAARVGREGYALLREKRREVRRVPPEVLRSLAFDNFDGSLTEEDRERFGLPVNDALRAFHARDPNVGKIVAYHGEIETIPDGLGQLLGRENRDERVRAAVARFNPRWRTADPLVHEESGTFCDGDVLCRRRFRDHDHVGILFSRAVLARLRQDLAAALASPDMGGPDRAPVTAARPPDAARPLGLD